jgi:ribosomal protein S18 acetylase RimI-like enzyme
MQWLIAARKIWRKYFPAIPRDVIRLLKEHGEGHINSETIQHYEELESKCGVYISTAYRRGQVVAALLFTVERSRDWPRTFHSVVVVHRQHRREGHAEHMLRKAAETARKLKVDYLSYVAADNEPSVKLFKSLGAIEVSRSERIRRNGEHYLRLRLKL